MNPKSKRLVLFDAHAILHRAYHALPEFSNSKGEPTGALYGLSAMLIKIIGELKPDYMAAAYDLPKPTFRHEAFAGYKAGRVKADENLVIQLKRSRDVFTAFGIPIYDCVGFEADDILGTVVEKLKKNSDIEIVIASGDMDTLQLVSKKQVQVYTLKKGINDTILYDEMRVRERFGFGPELLPDYKGLNGDPSDNIGGVPGIGDKTATTLITNFGSIESIYKTLKKTPEAFAKAGIKERIVRLLTEHEEEALFSKELATIRRDAPIEFHLPKAVWVDTVELSKILALFSELEFRTLGARAKETLDKVRGGVSTDEKVSEVVEPTAITPVSLPPAEEKELLIAVSLLNSTISDPTPEDILRFAKDGSFADAQKTILADIEKKGLERVFTTIEKPLIPVLSRMEAWGVKVDTSHLKKLSVEYHKKLSALEKSIWKQSGEEFNVNSPKQLGEIYIEFFA